ncbi:hypothetical protein J2W49_000005 [Hydrogenophaga palleronii]|uniref:Uncharacterized protein n=1 Tax=Hydrogenophaga palleronii TaxID=65655 RepID=A0ABU1WFN6_9BURK|nr:hypothetical protein [Hydrogenophaga palleronii]MDR7148077.1 hypothetical protein [Hydrogenophaga palleronii]
MKADLPQRVQLNTRVWDKPLPVVTPEAHFSPTQGGAGVAATQPGTETARPPDTLSDIYTELVKLFRNV